MTIFRFTSLMAALTLSACTPFTPLAIEAANRQAAPGATTWQAEAPFLTQNCLVQARGGTVSSAALTAAGYEVRTRPIGIDDTFFQKVITTRGMFGETINADFEARDDLFENRCALSLNFDNLSGALVLAEFDRAIQANGYRVLFESGPLARVYANGADQVELSVFASDVSTSVSIRERR